MDELKARVELVSKTGVPNYFGEQRFGHEYGNLYKGISLLKGELQERQRNKKGIYISAVRSWLFNQSLSSRIKLELWNELLDGDALMISGSQSCFVEEQADYELRERFSCGALTLTGPLWGRGDMMPTGVAEKWERDQLSVWSDISDLLENVSLKQERRALKLQPENLSLESISDTECWLEFGLTSGSFATSVLRELCITSVPE
jgi:tRNA pseudouridine13 synthase